MGINERGVREMLDLFTDFIIQIAFSIALVLFLIGVGIGALIKERRGR